MQQTIARESVALRPLADEPAASKDRLACWPCNARHLPDGPNGGRKQERFEEPAGERDFESWIGTTLWTVAAP